MFKIVQTIEKGKKELTIIPTAWEEKGVLFWPKNRADKLIIQEHSQPEDNWLKLNCKLKRNHLVNLEVAEEELNRMLEEDDTEQEEQMPNVSLPRRRPRVLLPKGSIDLNDIAQSCVNNDVNITDSTSRDLTADTEPTSFIIYQNEIPEIQVVKPQAEEQNTLGTIVATLSTVIENLNKIMHQMAKFEIMLDEAISKFDKPTKLCACSQQKNNVLVTEFNPIEKVEDLDILEDQLKDKQVFQDYIDKMSFICGKTGKGKGVDVSYMLVDKFFDRKFMTLCSWAGGARDHKEKIAFKFYKNTIRLFFQTVHLADSDFTLAECETFFKNVIRNAVKRNESSNARASKSKKRPSNLSYKKETRQDAANKDDNEEILMMLSDDNEITTVIENSENTT